MIALLACLALQAEGARVVKDLEYGKAGDRPLLLDLYLPEKADGPAPLLVWVHGGGWQAGNKSQCLPARLGFPKRGWAVASVGYRLTGEAPHPAQIQDVKAAVRWLRANGEKHGLKTDRIGAWGSSAGGHLVALLGTSGDVKDFDVGAHLDRSSRVQAVCAYFPPTDLAAFAATPGYEGHAKPTSPESKLIGGPVLENKDKAAHASPTTYVGADDPPFFIVHGDKDPTVPPDQSVRLHEALKKAGVASELRMLPGAGHGGPAFNETGLVETVAAFFDKALRGK
jgi:acetyl esterase/lipase